MYMSMPIQVVGINDLDDMERDAVNRLADRYYPKIERELKDDVSLVIHIKTHNDQGRQRKYSVHTKVNAPSRIFTTENSVDWDINAALHKSFTGLIEQIRHQLHTDEQHSRVSRHPQE
jgi:hypothetical protein